MLAKPWNGILTKEPTAVLLVRQQGGSWRRTLSGSGLSGFCRLFDDAYEAAQEAASPTVFQPANDRGSVSRMHRFWSVRVCVRRCGVVHIQDTSSLEAVLCTLWAWRYHRSTIVGLSSEATGRHPSVRGWRERLFVKCFLGSIARYATRVVVPDQESHDRMLFRNVEPSRVELPGPDIDLAALYLYLYAESAPRVLAGSFHPRHKRNRTDRTDRPKTSNWSGSSGRSAWRTRMGIVGASLAVSLAAVVAVVTPSNKAVDHQLALSFGRQQQPFTAVFFPAPLRLPTKVDVGSPMTFRFAVSNQGDSTVTYHYAVRQSNSGNSNAVHGNIRVPSKKTVSAPLVLRALGGGPELTVRITVEPSGLSVSFHARLDQ